MSPYIGFFHSKPKTLGQIGKSGRRMHFYGTNETACSRGYQIRLAMGPSSMDMKVRPDAPPVVAQDLTSPVSSHNEWDPLEEIIVGRLESAVIPSSHPVVTCNIPGVAAWGQTLTAGFRYPQLMLAPAQRELDGFVTLLMSLGIAVTRPEAVSHKKRFSTPDWSSCVADDQHAVSRTGVAEAGNHRNADGALDIGAPKPQLTDELYDPDVRLPEKGEPMRYILTEFEPVFDAADFFRCSRDLFVTRSNVTNASGIE
jgi:glycine amidinotransferase